jgi:type IX secretion system PorP/SprF family membrane protein
VRAQDVAFSNPYTNPIYLNPAYTGLPAHWRAGLNYHYQGVGAGLPYMAYSIYGDYFFDDHNSGIGFFALADRTAAGGITKTTIAIPYAYRLKINNNTFLRMALQPAVNFAVYNTNSITLPDQIDANGNSTGTGGGNISSSPYFDVALGVLFSHKHFYAGFAVHHLASVSAMSVGDVTISTLPKFTLNAGYNHEILIYENSVTSARRGGYPLTFSPNLIIGQQGASNYFAVGTYLSLLDVAVGLHYKSSLGNASPHFLIVSAHYTGKLVTAAYHFEFGSFNKTFKVVPANSHEISVAIKIGSKSSISTVSYGMRVEEKIYDMPDI